MNVIIILCSCYWILIYNLSKEAEPTTTALEDNENQTTDNEDGTLEETVSLAAFSTKKIEGKTDKVSSTNPTIAQSASNVEGLHPFGNIARFLFFQITSLKLISWLWNNVYQCH